ncbi:MAG: MaoC family dehydratase [Actinobacteria bacterium]|nr:MaoC family dehydratase [Actinomycetota bacterium]MSW91798.1 MaoC family dehydratase [Actinomycetota bacterium]MSX88513.1 MaoC family dehydratase [Actinomycetota bacterium]MSY71161.1 MaoC family dehydratase [Actinomycetota bacterium]
MMEFQFDDVDGMNAAASDEYGAWGPEIEVTQEMINGFAELTGDRQWIHIDVERATKESPFGGPIAHGFLTLALVPKLNPGTLKIVGHGNATNFGAGGLRFLAPVPAGAKIHGKSRLVSAEARKNGTLVTTELAVHVVGNEKPSLSYNMQILYMPKRSA